MWGRSTRRAASLGLTVLALSASASIPPGSVTVLSKTLGYDEGLAARLVREPVPVLAFGFDCSTWPAGTRIANHATRCEAATMRAGLMREAASNGAVVLLGDVESAPGMEVVAQAREAQVPVFALSATFASTDVLLAVDGSKTFIGEQASKRLGARFGSAVLRLATIVRAEGDDEQPTVREIPQGGDYPEEARQADIEGVVKLNLTVDTEGRVTDVRVVKGLGYGLDEEAARRAKRIRFLPGKRGGKPAVTTTDFNMRFALTDE